jgi:hypothetical protein
MVHDCLAPHLDEVGDELLLDVGAVIAPEIADFRDATVRTFISEQLFFSSSDLQRLSIFRPPRPQDEHQLLLHFCAAIASEITDCRTPAPSDAALLGPGRESTAE